MADTFPTPPKTDWWDVAKQGASTVLGVTPEGRAAKSAYEKVKGGVPIGDIVQQQVDKGPDDPSRWVLNTIQDLGLIAAQTFQGLSRPENLALIGGMSLGQEQDILPVAANLGFSLNMTKDAIQGFAKGVDAAKKGNLREAGRLFGSAATNALLVGLAAKKGPKGATYRVSEGEVPKQLAGEVKARPTAKDIPLPTVQDAESSASEPMERRDALQAELVKTSDPAHARTLRRQIEQANRQVESASVASKAAGIAPAPWGTQTDFPKAPETMKGIVPVPAEPVPPPPDIIQQPRTIKAAGEAVTVTPDDVRAYVEARKGGKPVFVVGPKGDRQDLAQPESSESQRIAGHKLTADQHAEMFPGAKYRAGMTVGEAADAQPGVRHPESGRKYSSTQIDLPKPAADKITELAKTIPDADIAGKGREENPHVTVKYGLHDQEPEALQSFLRDHGPVTLTLGKTNFFPPSAGSEGNDVVVVEVDSPQLHGINGDISKTFPVTDTHPDYKPHITLAYVKPGAGQKYAGNRALEGQQVQAKEITFSSRNGQEHAIKLGGPTATLQPVPPAPDRLGEAPQKLEQRPGAFSKLISGLPRSDVMQLLAENGLELNDNDNIVFRDQRGGGYQVKMTKRDFVDWLLGNKKGDDPAAYSKDPEWQGLLSRARKLASKETSPAQPVPPPPQSTVPPSPAGGDFALTSPGQTAGPQIEPGWKTSLGAYDRATASKYLKSYRRNSEDAKLVADPKDPAKFWITFKPKTAAPPPPKALGPAGKKPYEKPTGPKPAPWESRGIFVERRVKELNRQAIDLMQAEKEVPEDVWKELEPLQDELEQNRAEERKEFPQIRPQEASKPSDRLMGREGTQKRPETPSAPPPEPIRELTPEQKYELEVNRAGAKWNGVQKDGDEVLGFMFTDPKTNSTLFLTPDKANKADIEKRIAESRAQYDQAKRPGESFEVGPPVKFVPERDGILFAGPKKHPVEYGYIELADAVPSHNAPDFTSNPAHPGQQRVSYEFNPAQRAKLQEHFMNPEPEQLLSDGVTGVEGPPVMTPDGKIAGGNGRTMLYQMLYGSDKAKMIRDAVVAAAQKGGAAGVESMRQPIRVRRIKPPDTLGEWMRLTEDLNLNPAAETTAPERAMSIGRRLSPSTMKAVAAGLEDIGPDTTIRDLMTARPVDFVQWLVDDGALATKDRIRYIDDETGGLNEEGRALYESAILGATIQDVRLLERGSRSVISKLASSLGPLTRLQGRDDEWGITHLITDAAQVVGEAQQRGLKVTDFLAQKALFGEPPPKAVKNLAEFLDRSNPNVKKGLNQFAGEAGMAGGGQGLLGSVVVNPWDSFNEAFVKPVEKGPPMTKAGKPKPESPAERERRERQNAEARKKAQEKYLTQEEYLNAVRESYEQAIRANEEN